MSGNQGFSIKDSKEKLRKIDIPVSSDINSERSFSFSRVRSKINHIYTPGEVYNLFSVSANPDAYTILPPRKHQDTVSLNGVYLSALEKLSSDHIGEENCASFPLVEIEGFFWKPQESIYYPRVWVSKKDKSEKLKEIVLNMNGDDAYRLLARMEASHKYHLAEIDFLRSQGLNPFVIDKREWKSVDSETLKNAVDFLVQFSLTEKSKPHYHPEDY